MSNSEIYACKIHVEEAMDDLINYQETFPIIEKAEDCKCNYCNEKADYLVKANLK